jgi:hypothetical protein
MASAAERKAAERARKREGGMMGFEIWVHIADWPRIKRYIDRLNKKRAQSNQSERTKHGQKTA